MFQNRDTIAAQATAAGEGGVAIVRVSGADCEAVVSRVFQAKNGKPLANRVLTYGCVMENGEIADEAMAVLMARAAQLYKGERRGDPLPRFAGARLQNFDAADGGGRADGRAGRVHLSGVHERAH